MFDIVCERYSQDEHLHHLLHQIHEEIKKMSTSIVTRDQFDAALTAAVTTIETAIADLVAKVAAGGVTTPQDFSTELATLQGVVGKATAADPGPQTPPPAAA